MLILHTRVILAKIFVIKNLNIYIVLFYIMFSLTLNTNFLIETLEDVLELEEIIDITSEEDNDETKEYDVTKYVIITNELQYFSQNNNEKVHPNPLMKYNMGNTRDHYSPPKATA